MTELTLYLHLLVLAGSVQASVSPVSLQTSKTAETYRAGTEQMEFTSSTSSHVAAPQDGGAYIKSTGQVGLVMHGVPVHRSS